MNNPAVNSQILYISPELSGMRLDQALAELLPQYSRNRLKQWVLDGQIRLDGQVVKPKTKVYSDQQLELEIEPETIEDGCEPENIPLDIIYSDDSIIVINKPADMVVHPAAGHRGGTIQNALLYHFPAQQLVPRAGIVHRLDKDTTGLMVVARTLQAHKSLVDQLQARTMKREYQAIVYGIVTAGGTVDQPIGRHPGDRIKKAVIEGGRPSVTHYRVAERFRAHTLLNLQLETGRTHQIRVHMQYIKHPVVGDPVYAGRGRIPPDASPEFIDALRGFNRQALHARKLSLVHPETSEAVSWQAEVPEDFRLLLDAIKLDFEKHNE